MSQPEIDKEKLFSEQDPRLINCERRIMELGGKSGAESLRALMTYGRVLALDWWRLRRDDIWRQYEMYCELQKVRDLDRSQAKKRSELLSEWVDMYGQAVSETFLETMITSCETEYERLSSLCDSVEGDAELFWQAVDEQIDNLITLSRKHRNYRAIRGGEITLHEIDCQINFWAAVLELLRNQTISDTIAETVVMASR